MKNSLKGRWAGYWVLSMVLLSTMSCTTTNSLLKGNYNSAAVVTSTSSSYDQVWEKLVDYLLAKGVGIKNIDKASGLIITETQSFKHSYAVETPSGEVSNQDALVVIPKIPHHHKPNVISGEWQIRVKPSDVKTSVSVHLAHLTCSVKTHAAKNQTGSITNYPIKSTGVFEKNIIDLVK